jgi:multisubunit Na+/H+ antiporter MnhF subunit
MNQINKAIILPIVAVLFMMLKVVSGFEISDAAVDMTTDAILSIIALIGIFTHPVKKDGE